MADPQAARQTQLRNIETKTGQSIDALHAVLAASGLVKTGERRSLLMAQFQLGYGDANAVALCFGQALPAQDGAVTAGPPAAPGDPGDPGDPLAAIYPGAKAGLRPLHDAVMALTAAWGPFEQAPKKAYVSLRRKKQFAMIGPATQQQIEIGLNAKALPPASRLRAVPPGGMCAYTVRVGSLQEVDAELAAWLRAAFDAAG